MQADSRFLKGLELFNQGKFYECHEVIEELWLETRDEYRNLYKGMIQAAAAIHLFLRGPQSGARRLHRSSVKYLKAYPAVSLGLRVSRLIRDLDGYFACFKGWDGKKKLTQPDALIPKVEYR